mgnify:CR=1 FL=1
MGDQRLKKGRVLFLIRVYNDLDHIVPIIWKMSALDAQPKFLFVGERFEDDYRINFIKKCGAVELNSPRFAFYAKFRPKSGFRRLTRLSDLFFELLVGRRLIQEKQISCVVTEWGGPEGKGMAPCILRPARALGIPVISVPHGYHTWVNNDFNDATSSSINATGDLPQMADRNRFSAYVVQSNNIKRYCVESGIDQSKIQVLGSARFCKEWSEINLQLCGKHNNFVNYENGISILFFLSHWVYNVDRKRCVNLLETIAQKENVNLVIKGHTRGRVTGGLSEDEEKRLDKYPSIKYADERLHSPFLVKQADVVIVFGSSICFEALQQRVPVCKPNFLSRNITIFDNSGLVFEANTEEEVIRFVTSEELRRSAMPTEEVLENFFKEHIEGRDDSPNTEVLLKYTNLIESTSKT